MYKIGMRVAAILASGALLLSGCSQGGTAASSGAGGEKVKLGMAISTLNNPFFVSLEKGAKDAAAAAGADLVVTDARDDATQQANQIQNFQAQQVKAVLINPVDSDAAGPMVAPLAAANLPVVAVDRAVNGAEVNALVASDNVAGGRMAAETLAKAIGEKGDIIVLQGVAGATASRERGQGFTEGIARFPNVKVVAKQPADFDRTKGLDVTTNLLQSNPKAVGVFAENDEMALGAIQALGDRAGKSVQVVGFDGTADGIAAVKQGTMFASIAQQPEELGKKSVETALKLAKGETVDKAISVPVVVVDKSNAK